MPSPHYRINTPTVTAETVDGEVLMIHLDSGNYYSLRDTGAAIWDGLERGIATDTIAAALGDRLGGDAPTLLDAFLAELVAENLVVAADAPAGAAPDPLTGGMDPQPRH